MFFSALICAVAFDAAAFQAQQPQQPPCDEKKPAGAVSPAGKKKSTGKKSGGAPGGSSAGGHGMPAVDGVNSKGFLPGTDPDFAKSMGWPVNGPTPLPGALLPSHRIVAYYGNPLSKKMGVLGEYPVDEMLKRLDNEVAHWTKADPSTPVIPALHLIAVVAQGAPGANGKYRTRMRDTLIAQVASWAEKKHALVFLDVQVGTGTIQEELPRLLPFLERPNFHLGVDPEFMLKNGVVPGTKIGTMDASDINYVIKTVADLVTQKKLAPKILIFHRFTKNMITNAKSIKLDPRVQVIIDMDGWGDPWLKRNSYRDYIVREPVQYTGFKLFYHNDTKKGTPMMTPEEVLKFRPVPLYIQYQ